MAAQQFNRDNLHDVLPLRRLTISNPNHKINDNNYDRRSHIDDLNDTLLELIFIRILQWRHLVTCKCVSKRWNLIILNPDFARYLNKKHSPFTLLVREGWSAPQCLITEHPYFQTHNRCLNDFSPLDIVANHNDILVVWRATGRKKAYNIMNPLTKQLMVIPVPSREYSYYYSSNSCRVGFAGFVDGVSTIDVPNVMGFRIICTVMTYQSKSIWYKYSSETGKWKKYSVNDLGFRFKTDDICNRLLEDHAVTVNNKIHWRGRSNKILVIDPFVDDMLWYCVLNLPSAIQEDSVLGSCTNRLRIAHSKSSKVGLRIKVWEFDNYDDDMIKSGSNNIAKLRLVINIALNTNLISSFKGLLRCTKNKMICCHPNDPDIVYVV